MQRPPFTYLPDRSIEILNKTQDYLENHLEIDNKIYDLSWIYHSLFNIIPTTTDNFWSGHQFPYDESWEEIQISYNLICFGLYKQAMASLRSALELGLLSAYYNINNEGHIIVKKWLSSAETKEADTPYFGDVWKILEKNENIKKFQQSFDIKKRLLDLGYLHNYIHTKGHVYSNKFGRLKSNWQTFEEDLVIKWLNTFEEIVILVMTLHLLKYPTGLITYDYSLKFGIDIPTFSHLREHEIEKLKQYMPNNYFELLVNISENHTDTKDFLEWIESLPDLSLEDIENQIVGKDKRAIERHGFSDYKRQQLIIYMVEKFSDLPITVKERINKLEKWANENNFIEPKWKK